VPVLHHFNSDASFIWLSSRFALVLVDSLLACCVRGASLRTAQPKSGQTALV
jgi:hypothetical protein